MKSALITAALIAASALVAPLRAADFNFFGRSGDAIELNLGSIPGIAAGSTFSNLNILGFGSHTVVTSDTLTAQPFSTSGRLWVFANPYVDTALEGDTNPAARGFQGTLSGSLQVNGVTKTFSVTVQPGYTGSGAGSVGQSLEQWGNPNNNPLFAAQQQQRLRYLGFVPQGGGLLSADGNFGPATDQATRTFQAAFIGGINTTQADADGIIGPNTAGWLNAQNAPTWGELVDPDPQVPGTWSTSTMIGDFDILPDTDPGTGVRTGNTPQPERYGTSWSIDLVQKGSHQARLATGRTQRINAISMFDGYSSSCCHDTHRVGMDIDLGTVASTWNFGDGTLSSEEQKVAQHAIGFLNAGASGRVIRFITSNQDIYDAIHAASPSTALFYDTTGGHQNHLHMDIGPPAQVAGLGNLTGDFNLDDKVDANDYVTWRANLNKTLTQSNYTQWRANFGRIITNRSATGAELGSAAVPEPDVLLLTALLGIVAGTLRVP